MNVVENASKGFIGGLRKGAERKEAQRGIKTAKDLIQLGGRYRLFFPLKPGERDLIAATVPGRKCDAKRLKRAFLPLDDYDETNDQPVSDDSVIAKYARIAKVIHAAEAKYEMADAEEQAQKTSKNTGQPINAVALQLRLKEIENEYFGDPDAKPQAIYATKSPLIGSLVLEMATEALVVPLTAANEPEWNKADVMTVSLSKTKVEQIIGLLDNPDYCRPEEGYLEVGYDYIGTSRKAAGQVAKYQGIAESLSLKTKNPTAWETEAKPALKKLASTDKMVKDRCPSFNGRQTTAETVKRFLKTISAMPLVVSKIPTIEEELLTRNAKVLLEYNVGTDQPNVKALLEEIVAKQEAESDDITNDITDEEIVAAESATTLKELVDNVEDLGAAMGNVETQLEDVDIDELAPIE